MGNLKITVSLAEEGSLPLFEQSEYVYSYDGKSNHQTDAQVHLMHMMKSANAKLDDVVDEDFLTKVEKSLSVIQKRYGLQKYL